MQERRLSPHIESLQRRDGYQAADCLIVSCAHACVSLLQSADQPSFTFDRPPSAPPDHSRPISAPNTPKLVPQNPSAAQPAPFSVGRVVKSGRPISLTLQKSVSTPGQQTASLLGPPAKAAGASRKMIEVDDSVASVTAIPFHLPSRQRLDAPVSTTTTAPPQLPQALPSPAPAPAVPKPAKPQPPYTAPNKPMIEACAVLHLLPSLVDASPIVRQQALLGIVRLVSTEPHSTIWRTVVQLQRDRKDPGDANESDGGGDGRITPGNILGDPVPLRRAYTDKDQRQPTAPIATISSALSEFGLLDAQVRTCLFFP